MDDPISEIPQELNPDFFVWKSGEDNIGFPSDAAAIRASTEKSLVLGASGGKYEEKGAALATRKDLRGLCIDGRNVPQPLIDAAGTINSLERIHLGFIGKRSLQPLAGLTNLTSLYLEGAKGVQEFSIGAVTKLRSALISGDAEAVTTLLQEGNRNVRYLGLGGTASANLKLPGLGFLEHFPGLEYLALFDVSVKSRSLEPCLALPRLQGVVVNFSRSYRRESIEALEEQGVWVRCRMDEIRDQMG